MRVTDPKPGQVWRKGEDWRRVERVFPMRMKIMVAFKTFDGIIAEMGTLNDWRAWAKDAELMNPDDGGRANG